METELQYIENLKNNDSFFEEEFSRLDDYYELSCKKEIHDFVRKNEGILLLLDAVKPGLEKYFQNDEYKLYVSYDPEIVDDVKLVLLINVSHERFQNGADDDLWKITLNILPLRRKINIFREFLLMQGVLNV